MSISRETFLEAGNTEWQLYSMPHANLIVTGRGQELIENDPQSVRDIRNYRRAVIAQSTGRAAFAAGVPEYVRRHLASGGNSDVYSVNDRVVMKEASTTQSAYYAMQRMDLLCNVIESEVPRWIDIPNHFGLLTSRELSKQYMFMQKIDAGLTVEHVLSGKASTPEQTVQLQEKFGMLTGQERDVLNDQFTAAGQLLHGALERHGMDPDQYMPDWHEGNVLAEHLRVPIAGSPFRLWVIDQ